MAKRSMPRILVGLENSDVHIRREHNVTTARDVDFHFITVKYCNGKYVLP